MILAKNFRSTNRYFLDMHNLLIAVNLNRISREEYYLSSPAEIVVFRSVEVRNDTYNLELFDSDLRRYICVSSVEKPSEERRSFQSERIQKFQKLTLEGFVFPPLRKYENISVSEVEFGKIIILEIEFMGKITSFPFELHSQQKLGQKISDPELRLSVVNASYNLYRHFSEKRYKKMKKVESAVIDIKEELEELKRSLGEEKKARQQLDERIRNKDLSYVWSFVPFKFDEEKGLFVFPAFHNNFKSEGGSPVVCRKQPELIIVRWGGGYRIQGRISIEAFTSHEQEFDISNCFLTFYCFDHFTNVQEFPYRSKHKVCVAQFQSTDIGKVTTFNLGHVCQPSRNDDEEEEEGKIKKINMISDFKIDFGHLKQGFAILVEGNFRSLKNVKIGGYSCIMISKQESTY